MCSKPGSERRSKRGFCQKSHGSRLCSWRDRIHIPDMTISSKLTIKRVKRKQVGLNGSLDVSSPATATAFRAAAKAYTKEATRTKAAAVKTLHRERILTKGGKFTKAYAVKG
jgi:hypothetical protein